MTMTRRTIIAIGTLTARISGCCCFVCRLSIRIQHLIISEVQIQRRGKNQRKRKRTAIIGGRMTNRNERHVTFISFFFAWEVIGTEARATHRRTSGLHQSVSLCSGSPSSPSHTPCPSSSHSLCSLRYLASTTLLPPGRGLSSLLQTCHLAQIGLRLATLGAVFRSLRRRP